MVHALTYRHELPNTRVKIMRLIVSETDGSKTTKQDFCRVG
jgi:hypothetical protein